MKISSLKVGVVTLLVTFLLNMGFRFSPDFYEVVYFRTVYQAIRVAHDFTLGYLPIPSLYLMLIFMLWFFFRKVRANLKSWLKCLFLFLVWIVILFYWLWGFNYNQERLSSRLELEIPAIDSTYITQEFLKQTELLYALKDSMTGTTSKYYSFESHIRENQVAILNQWNMPTKGRVRVRYMIPGSLLHFRTSGIYIPHASEGHVDIGLYKKQHPFTIAHEMSHGYGITDESEANFVGYMTCIRSNRLEVVYSAELAYWRYLIRYYRSFHPDDWSDYYNGLDPRLIQDLNLIQNHIKKYKDWMPKYRDVIYDNYLKTHGVKAGIRSYDQMILLIAAYKNKYGSVN